MEHMWPQRDNDRTIHQAWSDWGRGPQLWVWKRCSRGLEFYAFLKPVLCFNGLTVFSHYSADSEYGRESWVTFASSAFTGPSADPSKGEMKQELSAGERDWGAFSLGRAKFSMKTSKGIQGLCKRFLLNVVSVRRALMLVNLPSIHWLCVTSEYHVLLPT